MADQAPPGRPDRPWAHVDDAKLNEPLSSVHAGEHETTSPTVATKAPDPRDDANLWIHARCHMRGRLAAFIGPDNRLTICCGECWRPFVTVADHHGMFASIRALGCQAGGHDDGQ